MLDLKEGDFVNLIKLTDDVFNGNHPNLINEGHKIHGQLVETPTIGHNVVLIKVSGDSQGWFRTSTIKNIDGDLIKTRNSTYKIEKYGNSNS